MELPILTRGPNVPPFATEVLDKCPTSTFMQPYSLTSMVILSTYLCVCLLLQFWSWYKWRVTFADEEEAPWNAFSWVVWLFRSTRPSRPSSIRTFPGSKMKPKNQQRRLQAASCINDTLGYWRYTFFLKEHSFWKIISEDPYANRPEFQAIAVKELTWASGSTFPDYPYHSLCRIFARIRSHNLRKKGDILVYTLHRTAKTVLKKHWSLL